MQSSLRQEAAHRADTGSLKGRDATTFDALAPASAIGAVIYALMTTSLVLRRSQHDLPLWVAGYTAVSALVLGAVWLALRSRHGDVIRRRPVPWAAGLALLYCSNPVVFMAVTGQARPSIGMVLVIVGVGALLHHAGAAWTVIAICDVAWVVCAIVLGTDGSPRAFAGELVMTNLAALILNLSRVRTVTRLEEARARASRLASTDSLTGLANHRAVLRHGANALVRARRTGASCCAVAYVDIDGLKEVNDARGHAAGDRLIRQAADALRSVVRSDELAGRVGGDEFVVVTTDLDEDQATALTARFRSALAAEGISASIGVARSTPTDTDFVEVLGRADLAMYVDKLSRRSS